MYCPIEIPIAISNASTAFVQYHATRSDSVHVTENMLSTTHHFPVTTHELLECQSFYFFPVMSYIGRNAYDERFFSVRNVLLSTTYWHLILDISTPSLLFYVPFNCILPRKLILLRNAIDSNLCLFI